MLSRKQLKETILVRLFGITQVPLIWWVAPIVLNVGIARTEIRINLGWRTRNHLKSMYFGALAIGADVAGGLLFMNLMREKGLKASFVFKDMNAKFLKRADGDVHFVCDSGPSVASLVDRCLASPERQETTVEIKALVPTKYGDTPVAIFTLTLSVKRMT